MKTKLLIFLLLPLSISAQEFDFRINLGANLSYVTNDGLTNSILERSDNFGAGLLFGAYFDYNFTDNLILDTELNFRQKKIKTTSSSIIENPKLNFVDISPSIKYSFGKTVKEGFFIGVGTRVSFLTQSKTENGDEIEDFFNKTTFGAQLGIGYSFSNLVLLQAKLDYELSGLLDKEVSDGNTNSLAVFIFEIEPA